MRHTAILLLTYFYLCFNLNAKAKNSNSIFFTTISVSSYGAIPNDGLDDTKAIRSAIAAAKANNLPHVIMFDAGRYDLKVSGNSPFISLLNANNITLKGATLNNQPATQLVRFNNVGENGNMQPIIQIRFSSNITIENFILDNDPYYYTAGKVTDITGTSVTVDVLAGHPMNIYKPYIMGIYDDLNARNKKLRITWDKNLPTWSAVSGGSGRLMKLDFKALSDQVAIGDDVFWFQGNHGGAQCVTSKSEDIAFTNVITHNATGFVYHFVDNENITWIGQNLKYDFLVLKWYGVELLGKTFDTMLAHYVIEPEGRRSMDLLSAQYLGYEPVHIEALIGKKGKNQGSMRDAALEQIKEYAAEDADITLQLKHCFVIGNKLLLHFVNNKSYIVNFNELPFSRKYIEVLWRKNLVCQSFIRHQQRPKNRLHCQKRFGKNPNYEND